MIDNLNDWSHVYQHSSNLMFDTTNSQYMRGDTSRAIRTTATHEFVTWRLVNMVSFQAISYFWPAEPVSAFSIYTSANGVNWRPATPQIVSIYGDWPEYIYTLQGLSNTNYVKMVWNNLTGKVWNPNLGAVSILFFWIPVPLMAGRPEPDGKLTNSKPKSPTWKSNAIAFLQAIP